jgi:hypothetical protein
VNLSYGVTSQFTSRGASKILSSAVLIDHRSTPFQVHLKHRDRPAIPINLQSPGEAGISILAITIAPLVSS